MIKLKKLFLFFTAFIMIFTMLPGCVISGQPDDDTEPEPDPVIVPVPESVSFVAPTAAQLEPGDYLLNAEIVPSEANQGVKFSLTEQVGGVYIDGNTLTIGEMAARGAVISVKAESVVKSDVSATKDFIVDNIWSKQPVQKTGEIFYDDFSEGIRASHWRTYATGNGWGIGENEVRNYMNANNTYWSTDAGQVEELGATGGVVAMQANGDLHPTATKRREGTAIITNKAFGPGLYEIRFKPLPRLGQVTAFWTYWNGGGSTLETNKYSEIDIEMPEKADYRQWSANVYKKYISSSMKVQGTVAPIKESTALNNGEWLTMAFEWRTDEANGDSAVQYYVNGKKSAKLSGTYSPDYTATFWMGTWFPDNPGWIGVPDFETAYMYIDWVRITPYSDPVQTGGTGGWSNETGTVGVALGNNAVPKNDYIANPDFQVKSDGVITGWTPTIATDVLQSDSNGLQLPAEKRAYQLIRGQYAGTSFDLSADMQVISGAGNCKIYIEEYAGVVRVAVSPEISVNSADGLKNRTLSYTLRSERTTAIRVTVETESGTTAAVKNVKLMRI